MFFFKHKVGIWKRNVNPYGKTGSEKVKIKIISGDEKETRDEMEHYWMLIMKVKIVRSKKLCRVPRQQLTAMSINVISL